MPRYYFSKSDGTCKRFLYGGCAGNANNFLTEDACQSRCSSSSSSSPSVEVQGRPVLCSLPAETGMCRALYERWFYDDNDGRCRLFTWGGCGGNDNNFSSKYGREKLLQKNSFFFCRYHS